MLRLLVFALGTLCAADPMPPALSPLEAIFTANLTKPYVVKRSWTDNFVRFNYVLEAKSARPRIVAVGCVPSNLDDGALLNVGESSRQHDFVFACQRDVHGVVSYEANACIDGHGNDMALGEARPMANGTVYMQCGIFGGVVKKVIEKAAGCFFNGTLYKEDETWIEPLQEAEEKEEEQRDEIVRKPKSGWKDSASIREIRLRGHLMQCFRPHYNYFESQLIGCVVGKFGIRVDEYAQIEKGVHVKCLEREGGTGVEVKRIEVDDLTCRFGNESMPEGAVWEDPERAAEFACSSGNVVKRACVIASERIPLGKEVRLSNGCIFVCHPGANVYMCDKLLPNTITLPDEIEQTGVVFGAHKIDEAEDFARARRRRRSFPRGAALWDEQIVVEQ